MDWEDLLIYIIKAVCGLVISVGIPLLFTVILINQTYVDALKEEGLFDKEAQKAAFEMCKEKVLAMLNDEAIVAIAETFGDYEEWIRTLIEAYVRENKLEFVEITEE